MKAMVTAAALFILCAVTALPASAQHVSGPQPLEKENPRAKRAAEFVEVMLTKDRKAVEAYLKQHGAAAYAGSGAMKTQLDAQLARLKARTFTVQRFEKGRGSDVLVWLRDAQGKEENIVVQMEGEAPHKITGLLEARIVRG